MNPKQQRFLARASVVLDEQFPYGATLRELTAALVVPHQAAEEIVKIGVREGSLVSVDGRLLFTVEGQAKLGEKLRALAGSDGISSTELREQTGVSRGHAEILLQHFDRLETLERNGGRWFRR